MGAVSPTTAPQQRCSPSHHWQVGMLLQLPLLLVQVCLRWAVQQGRQGLLSVVEE